MSLRKTIEDTAKDPIKASTIAGAVVGGATGGAIGFGVGNMVKDVADGVKEVKNKLLESSELEFKVKEKAKSGLDKLKTVTSD